jgi:hypothetical protein
MVENSSKPWTSEEEDRLRELVISNAAAFDIAAELWTNRIWARPLFKLIAVHREAAGPAASPLARARCAANFCTLCGISLSWPFCGT